MDLRSYDPAIARFNGIDPVTHFSQGTSVAFDNNPVFWADPSGADGVTFFNNGSQEFANAWNDVVRDSKTWDRGPIIDPNGNEADFADDWYTAVDGNLVMTNGTDYQVWNPETGALSRHIISKPS